MAKDLFTGEQLGQSSADDSVFSPGAQDINMSVMRTQTVDPEPDLATESAKIGASLGLDPGMVAGDIEFYRDKYFRNKQEGILKMSPALAHHFAEADYDARAASGEVDLLDNLVAPFANFGSGLKQSLIQARLNKVYVRAANENRALTPDEQKEVDGYNKLISDMMLDPSTGGGSRGMGRVGQLISATGNVAGGMSIGWAQFLPEAAVDTATAVAAEAGAMAGIIENTGVAQAAGGVKFEDTAESDFLNFAEKAAKAAGSTVAANPIGSFVSNSQGEFFREALDRGIKPEDAAPMALFAGGLLGSVDGMLAYVTVGAGQAARGGLKLLTKMAPAMERSPIAAALLKQAGATMKAELFDQSKAQIIKGVASSFIKRVGGETGQELLQDWGERAALAYTEEDSKGSDLRTKWDATFRAMFDRDALASYGDTALTTVFATTFLGIPGALGHYYTSLGNVARADFGQKKAAAIVDYAKNSKVAEKDPTVTERVINKVAGNDAVSVNAVELRESAKKKGIDLGDLLVKLGVSPDAFEVATSSNGHVSIESGKYAVVLGRSGLAEQLYPHTSFDGEMTFAEATAAADKTIEEIAKQAVADGVGSIDLSALNEADPETAVTMAEKLVETMSLMDPSAGEAVKERVAPVIEEKRKQLEGSLPEGRTLTDEQLVTSLKEAGVKGVSLEAISGSKDLFQKRKEDLSDTEKQMADMRMEYETRYNQARQKRITEFGQSVRGDQRAPSDERYQGTRTGARDLARAQVSLVNNGTHGLAPVPNKDIVRLRNKLTGTLMSNVGLERKEAEAVAHAFSNQVGYLASVVGIPVEEVLKHGNVAIAGLSPEAIMDMRIERAIKKEAEARNPADAALWASRVADLRAAKARIAVDRGAAPLGLHVAEHKYVNDIVKWFNKVVLSKDERWDGGQVRTMVHELSGHAFLSVMRTLADQFPENAGLRSEIDKIKTYLGATSLWNLTSEQNELWARSVERFFDYNEAPTEELRTVMEKVRGFMYYTIRAFQEVIDTIKSFGGKYELPRKLPSEIRELMNRMFSGSTVASENLRGIGSGNAPIDRVATSLGLVPNIPSSQWFDGVDSPMEDPSVPPRSDDQNVAAAQPTGMSPEAAAQYATMVQVEREKAQERLSEELQRIEKRKMKAKVAAARPGVVDRVVAKYSTDREYSAISRLSKNQMVDGTDLSTDLPKIKLDEGQLVKEFGQEAADRINALGDGSKLSHKKGGISLEDAAVQLGYESAKEMVDSLLATTPFKEVVQAETRDILEREFGLRDDSEVRDAVERSLFGDERENRIQFEAEQLVKQQHVSASGQAVSTFANRTLNFKAIKQRVERTVSNMKIGSINPSAALRVASKNSIAAKEFILAGKPLQALDAIVGEYIATVQYRAMRDAADTMDYVGRKLKALTSKAAQQRLGKAGLRDNANYYLYLLGLRPKLSQDEMDGVMPYDDLLKKLQEEFGMTDPGTPWARVMMEDGKVDQNPSVVALTQVTQFLGQLARAAAFNDDLIVEGNKQQMDDIVAELATTGAGPGKPVPIANKGASDLLRGALSSGDAFLTKMEFLFHYLDGGKENGPWWSSIFAPIARAEADAARKNSELAAEVKDAFSAYSSKEKKTIGNASYKTRSGKKFSRENAIVALLNTGNDYNRRALLGGERGLTEADLEDMLSILTEKDRKLADSLWKIMDSLWPEIRNLELETNGIAPEKVPGRYWPVKFDSRSTPVNGKVDEGARDIQSFFSNAPASAQTPHGHTRQRVGTGGRALRLDFGVMGEHLNSVVHDLTHRKALKQSWAILQNNTVRRELSAKTSPAMHSAALQWLGYVAHSYRRESVGPYGGVLRYLRNGATISLLSFNAMTTIKQLSGYSFSVKQIGLDAMRRGVKAMLPKGLGGMGAIDAYNFATSKSQFMKDRISSGRHADIADFMADSGVTNSLSGPLLKIPGAKDKILAMGMNMIGWGQMAVDLPTWMGAYASALDGKVEGIVEGDERSAIEYADKSVRMSQGSGSLKDRANVQNANEIFRMFAMFYTFFSTQYNQLGLTARDFKDTKNWAALGASLGLLFMPIVLDSLIEGDAGDDDWMDKVVMKGVTYPFQGIPIVRDGIDFAVRKGMGQQANITSPVLKSYESISSLGSSAIKISRGKKLTKSDKKQAALAIGVITHLPTPQLLKLYNKLAEE